MPIHSRVVVCSNETDADREVIAQKALPNVSDAKKVKTDLFDQPADKYFNEIYDLTSSAAQGDTWLILVALKS